MTKDKYHQLNNYCLQGKHKPRDNTFGVTWCIKCGRLFTKSSGKPLKESDQLIVNK
jgi:hypothetical protein